MRVGMYTFNSRLGTLITAYKSESRSSNWAARSKRDIIDSKGLSSLISLMSSTIAVGMLESPSCSDRLELFFPVLRWTFLTESSSQEFRSSIPYGSHVNRESHSEIPVRENVQPIHRSQHGSASGQILPARSPAAPDPRDAARETHESPARA